MVGERRKLGKWECVDVEFLQEDNAVRVTVYPDGMQFQMPLSSIVDYGSSKYHQLIGEAIEGDPVSAARVFASEVFKGAVVSDGAVTGAKMSNDRITKEAYSNKLAVELHKLSMDTLYNGLSFVGDYGAKNIEEDIEKGDALTVRPDGKIGRMTDCIQETRRLYAEMADKKIKDAGDQPYTVSNKSFAAMPKYTIQEMIEADGEPNGFLRKLMESSVKRIKEGERNGFFARSSFRSWRQQEAELDAAQALGSYDGSIYSMAKEKLKKLRDNPIGILGRRVGDDCVEVLPTVEPQGDGLITPSANEEAKIRARYGLIIDDGHGYIDKPPADVCKWAKPKLIRIDGKPVSCAISRDAYPREEKYSYSELAARQRMDDIDRLTKLNQEAGRARIYRSSKWPWCPVCFQNVGIAWVDHKAHWLCYQCSGTVNIEHWEVGYM